MDEAINATKNFNDSLQYQWMTTDVLVNTLRDYADETTEIGKKAFAEPAQSYTWLWKPHLHLRRKWQLRSIYPESPLQRLPV